MTTSSPLALRLAVAAVWLLVATLGAACGGGSATTAGSSGGTAPAPSVAFAANPSTIMSGGASTLTWSSDEATSCGASGAWSGPKATAGAEPISDITTTSTYTLTCTGAGGSASRSVTIAVSTSDNPPIDDQLPILRNQTPDTWSVVSKNTLADVYPSPIPPGATGPSSIMLAWSGGAYDTRRDRLMVWGGGHTDYSGNEVYAFELKTGYWRRLTAPSTDVGGSFSSGRYPDGNPRAVHSYNTLAYVPSIDRFMAFGMAGPYPAGAELANTWALDVTTTPPTWIERAPVPVPGFGTGGVPVPDPQTGRVWYHGYSTSHLAEYDPGTNTWTQYPSSSTALEIYGTAALDPVRRKLILVGGYGGARTFVLWDLDYPQNPPTRPATSGATALETSAAVGFDFDSQTNRFFGWNGGTTVYALNPDTLTWTTLPLSPANTVTPGPANSNGTYGRFRYVPSVHGLIVVNHTNGSVYFYKL